MNKKYLKELIIRKSYIMNYTNNSQVGTYVLLIREFMYF